MVRYFNGEAVLNFGNTNSCSDVPDVVGIAKTHVAESVGINLQYSTINRFLNNMFKIISSEKKSAKK